MDSPFEPRETVPLPFGLDVPRDDLTRRFTYHPPTGDQPEKYAAIRMNALALAKMIDGSQPMSREKALALTALEEAVMWANAGIARNT